MSSSNARHGTRWKRLTSALVALALAGAGVLALAEPAAAAAPSDCDPGYHCSYSGYSYGNDAWQQPSTHRFLNCVDEMSIGWRTYRDVTSSAYNNGRSQTSYLYSGVKQTGSKITFLRGTGITNLGSRSFNDTAESGYFQSTLGSKGSGLCL